MRLPTLVVVLVVLVAVAGCGSKPPTPTDTTAPPATGRIEGRVLDDASAVVPGAEVRVLLTSLVTTTDAQGYFEFAGAPAGAVRVVASADSHTSQTKSGTLPANGELTLNFVLTAIAIVQPYHEPRQFTGTISCGLPQGVACPSDPMTPTEEDQPVRFDVASGLAGIVFELEWQPPVEGANTELAFDVQAASADACGARYVGASGPSVLKLIVLEGFPISGGFQCVHVFAPSENATVQQEYTMHYTLFYHEPPPEGFSALS